MFDGTTTLERGAGRADTGRVRARPTRRHASSKLEAAPLAENKDQASPSDTRGGGIVGEQERLPSLAGRCVGLVRHAGFIEHVLDEALHSGLRL